MVVSVPLAVLHVVWKTRVGETKILRNHIITAYYCCIVQLQLFFISVFKTDPRKLDYSVARMVVGVPLALLHVILKTRR